MTPVIETPRLLLRPYRDADAADLYAYSRDPRVGVIAGWQPHRSEEESLYFIRTVFSAPDVFALELAGKAFVLAPSHPFRVSTYSMKEADEQALYDMGMEDFRNQKARLKAFLSGE